MEGKEKNPIRKKGNVSQEGLEKYLDYKQFADDVAFYKICMEIASQAKFFDSEEEAFDYVFESHEENIKYEGPLFQRYEEQGPIDFEYLKKNYESKFDRIGLEIEEIRSFETHKIAREEEEIEENSDDKDKTNTEDFFKEEELISVKDYKKFIEYLKNIKTEDLNDQAIKFINSLLSDFIKGLQKEYSIEKEDVRLEELIFASRDIATEIERLDGYFQDPVFDRLPEFQDYIDAARGGYL